MGQLIFVNVNCFCSDLMEGYKVAELDSEEHSKNERSYRAQCQAIADMKFTYVVSCQQYGIDKRSGHSRAKDILKLMTKYVSYIKFLSCYCFSKKLSYLSRFPCLRYPSLRVAYIDEVEEASKDNSKKTVQKVYYSALVKAALPTKAIDSSEPVQNLDQVHNLDYSGN